jgi:PIN domain nuclease of toxin-antitoxin system
MRLLIDTHVLLWWDQDSTDLSQRARTFIADPANEIYVSAASVLEIAIKRRLNKLEFDGSVSDAVARNGFAGLEIDMEDAEMAGQIDWPHADPFDRLLVAQSLRRELTLVTADNIICAFPGLATLRAR